MYICSDYILGIIGFGPTTLICHKGIKMGDRVQLYSVGPMGVLSMPVCICGLHPTIQQVHPLLMCACMVATEGSL